jgi:hypothetical protein
MRRAVIAALGPLGALAAAGCSSVLGIEDLRGPGVDAGPVAAQVTVSGTVKINNAGQPPYSTAVTLVQPDGTIIATGTSDVHGEFALTASTGGVPLDVALHVSGSPPNSRDVYFYPPPLHADHDAGSVLVLLEGDVANVVTSFGYSYSRPMMVIVADVRDARGDHVAGETISTPVATVIVRYTKDGVPSSAFETSDDGIAYAFDYDTVVTMVTATGAVRIPPRRIRPVPAALTVVDLRP